MNCYIFDLDGTLLDSRHAMLSIFDQIALEDGVKPNLDHGWEGFISLGGIELINYVFNGCKDNKQRLNRFRRKYLNIKHQKRDFYKGALEYLEKIHSRNQVFLVTNKPRAIVEKILYEVDAMRFFSNIWCRGDSGLVKPSQELANYILFRLRQNVDEIWLYGDSFADRNLASMIKGCIYMHHENGFEPASESDHVFKYEDFSNV